MAIYFASDVHLGLKFGQKSPQEREKIFVDWLRKITPDCQELFLVGDIFDFYFEWKRVVPKGFVITLAQLAQMSSSGIKIHFFTGNHDLWIRDYLSKEIGLVIHTKPLVAKIDGCRFFIAHGDTFYKHNVIGRFLSFVFRSSAVRKVAQRLIHPDAMVRFGQSWSQSNREKRGRVAHIFGDEDDFLVKFSREYLATVDPNIEYFVFGHEHTPIVYPLTKRSKMVILGEWVESPVVARLEGSSVILETICGNAI